MDERSNAQRESRTAQSLVGELAEEDCRPLAQNPALAQIRGRKLSPQVDRLASQRESDPQRVKFRSNLKGLNVAYDIGRLEREDHRPGILVSWRRVQLTFSTHSVKGLNRHDFYVAFMIGFFSNVVVIYKLGS